MIEIGWSARAEREFNKQIAYLENHISKKAIVQYLAEVAQAIEGISSEKVAYQLIETNKNIRCYRINKHINLYYKEVNQDKVILLTFFDTRQDPGKLKL